MRRAALPPLALLVLWAAPLRADETQVELLARPSIHDLRLGDADGDGLQDVLLLEGRLLQCFCGRRGRLPQAAPSWTLRLPDGASFVDLLPPGGGAPGALLTIGTAGAERTPLSADAPPHALEGGDPTSWRDAEQAAFVRLALPGGGLLLPSRSGWRFVLPDAAAAPIHLTTTPSYAVRPPGPFLEDTCDVTIAWPAVFVGAPAQAGRRADASALWALTGRELVSQSHEGRVTYDLSFLRWEGRGQSVVQQLVDLDGDGRPELMHRIFNNREARYGFFRTRPADAAEGTGPTHKPALSDVYLPGFPLEPELVDLDGDGLVDLVLTSIEINAANTLRALGSGKVTAETHAFLNRWRDGQGRYFRQEADATVKSDIGVKVRFNYAGTIEVERSFTILTDGDFDADGRKDLAIRTGEDTLTVRRGSASGVWEKEGRETAIPPLGEHPDVDGFSADLDGDGRDEVVLHYRKPPGGRDRLLVVRIRP